jgi:hypothetical protein
MKPFTNALVSYGGEKPTGEDLYGEPDYTPEGIGDIGAVYP